MDAEEVAAPEYVDEAPVAAAAAPRGAPVRFQVTLDSCVARAVAGVQCVLLPTPILTRAPRSLACPATPCRVATSAVVAVAGSWTVAATATVVAATATAATASRSGTTGVGTCGRVRGRVSCVVAPAPHLACGCVFVQRWLQPPSQQQPWWRRRIQQPWPRQLRWPQRWRRRWWPQRRPQRWPWWRAWWWPRWRPRRRPWWCAQAGVAFGCGPGLHAGGVQEGRVAVNQLTDQQPAPKRRKWETT